jgi:hypothetical protein
MPSVDAGIRSEQRVSGGTRGFSEGAGGFNPLNTIPQPDRL